MASGEYGDITTQLVKSWKIQEKREELKRMETGDFGEAGDNVDAMLAQQMMASFMPGCGFKSSTDSLSSTTSQTTQVFGFTWHDQSESNLDSGPQFS